MFSAVEVPGTRGIVTEMTQELVRTDEKWGTGCEERMGIDGSWLRQEDKNNEGQ